MKESRLADLPEPSELEEEERETTERQSPDDIRLNQWLDQVTDAKVRLVKWATVCGVGIILIASLALVLLIGSVTTHYLIHPILEDRQVMAISAAALGFKDLLSGGALSSALFLFWRSRRRR